MLKALTPYRFLSWYAVLFCIFGVIMKRLTLALLFVTLAGQLFSQHPLVGTWEMVSVKGISADGEKFFRDTTSIREVKVITPTHYILIAHDVENDSLIFNRSYAGTVRLEGNKYMETPQISSLPIFDNVKSNFTWKLEGDRFIQSGTFTRPDGKTVILEELVFRRVKVEPSYEKYPAIGTWRQLSSRYTTIDGVDESHTNETATRFHIITPTHWMRISHRDGKFENAMGGTYTLKNDKTYPLVLYGSFYKFPIGNLVMTERVEGDKLYVSGTGNSPDGRKFTWEDEFERVR